MDKKRVNRRLSVYCSGCHYTFFARTLKQVAFTALYRHISKGLSVQFFSINNKCLQIGSNRRFMFQEKSLIALSGLTVS